MTTTITSVQSNVIRFQGNSYSADLVPAFGGVQPKPLIEMNSSQLLELYNLVSSNLGRGRVKRFADMKTAIKRTWKILQEYAAQPDEDFAMSPEELARQAPRAALHDHVTGAIERGEKQPIAAIELTPEDKAQIKAEAAARAPAPGAPSEALLQAMAANRKVPTAEKPPLWRRPKHEDPAKTAYRPRAGTLQATMYDLLTTPGGILIEAFCDAVKATGTRDRTLFTAPNVWAAMRYLYVANRGYGLDFDGQRLALLVPKDERSTEPKKEG